MSIFRRKISYYKSLLLVTPYILLFYFFRIFPLQNKIIGVTMRGRKYGDNPQFIFEELYKIDSHIDFVWLKADNYEYSLPKWIRGIPYKLSIKTIFELATAKVWIDTHRLRACIRKRKSQLFIETWHGGLGIKKIEGDLPKVLSNPWDMAEIKNTAKLANVFISNSDHLSNIYRRAFFYKGNIYKCGYPKNDSLICPSSDISLRVKKELGLALNKKILLYAPTFRNEFCYCEERDFSVFDINYKIIKETVKNKWGGEWEILVKWHPTMIPYVKRFVHHDPEVKDVTTYNDMQALICSTDIIISDYSSCIFDAALREIPCFTFATDFEEYKSSQGTYFEMEELPFPYAKNNEELIRNIQLFNHEDYLTQWNEFKIKMGLSETGHAGKDIAQKIYRILNGEKTDWK